MQKHLNGNNILGIKIMDKNYKFPISEVSKISNFSNSAINYYLRMGLITPPKKSDPESPKKILSFFLKLK